MLKSFPSILIRCPLNSLEKLDKYQNGITPLFEDGLYLASPEFWTDYQKHSIPTLNKEDKVFRTFIKYWLRSCTRCTPYGTFAGFSTVEITPQQTSIVLQDENQHIARVRIDMNYISKIVQSIIFLPGIRNQLNFCINNSIYEVPEGFRYVEYKIVNNRRFYELISVQNASYLTSVLKRAKTGATINDLINLLVAEEDVDKEEAGAFIETLIEGQILIADLDPTVTGEEPIDQLVQKLRELNDVNDLVSAFEAIREIASSSVTGVNNYMKINRKLQELYLNASPPKNTLQVDLRLGMAKDNINEELTDAILKQVSDLFNLSRLSKNVHLEDFKKRFKAKYDTLEMPLAVVLDGECGIGFADYVGESANRDALINDLYIQANVFPSHTEPDYIQRFVIDKYAIFLKDGADAIVITEEELAAFKKNIQDLHFPKTMYVMGSLAGKNNLLDSENFVFDLSALGGTSAANLLGRFTHCDKNILGLAKQIIDFEENAQPDSVFAEIVHLPEARLGNILLRPVLRKYEIPYIGKSGVDSDKQIALDDLWVSVKGDEIILRSSKLDKVIIPRLTTAHNFNVQSLPVYRFLCSLQFQGLAFPVIWDWGVLDHLPHLPRVVYKNIIVKKANWKIDEKSLSQFTNIDADYISFAENFRRAFSIPEVVTYIESDNKLMLDLTKETGIKLLLHYLRANKSIVIEEYLVNIDNCVVHDITGAPYVNEIIIPVYHETSYNQKTISPTEKPNDVKRVFAPYSEWMFFKIYAGVNSIERILEETILDFITEGLKQDLFEKFFFIRYQDEDGKHIRIRFLNSDPSKHLALFKSFSECLQPLLASRTVYKITLDTYTRELERYGAAIIDEVESLFFFDSLAVLQFINLLDESAEENYRMVFAMRGIDMLLDDFDYTLYQKYQLASQLCGSFFKEFNGSTQLQKQLNDKYRSQRQFIDTHINPENDIINGIDEAASIFKERSLSNRRLVAAIQSKQGNKGLSHAAISNLMANIIHMYMNRLYLNKQRYFELVIYHFLERYYKSELAIAKGKTLVSASGNKSGIH